MGRFDRAKANIRRAYEAGRASVRARRNEVEPFVEEPPPADPGPEPVHVVEHASTSSRDDLEVPTGLRIAAAWGWRLLILGAIAFYALKIVNILSNVIIPLTIALLLSALLGPLVGVLVRAHFPRSLATAIVVLFGIGAVVGILTIVINQFVAGLPQVSDNAAQGVQDVRDWLKNGPFHVTNAQLEALGNQVQTWFTSNKGKLTSSALSTAAATAEALTGFFLVLFSLFFFLRDGRKIWNFFVGIMPPATREAVDYSANAAWHSLGSYVRATVLVAFIDAFGIGIALWILKVPFVFPLAALVFLFAFIPIIGATVSGAVAVLVAGVTVNWVTALLVLAAVIAVQQLEGHVLQPLIMGKAVAIHPLAVIAAIAGGLVLAGIIGALVAVPLVAMFNTGIRALNSRRREIAARLQAESSA
ncbi:AI-2E family transporter [Hamadaea tsunoensis]|uniref:AI-2E family transporter n=1 Tax=Hamadaea tsunoensis TaxID=53368 RepID=UPI000410A4B7|nr:AI-2E family transporter [Hamadaea tsunoensis]